jgi:hypothetical protein
MPVPDVYRFHELYAGQATQPAALSESETYRSHFGRYDLDGVQVEIMGDLHRREGNNWVPTWATTESTVDIDGAQCSASWLEEETLAYVRRNRLERAARCLPYCDHKRLLQLLRAVHETHVL